MFSVVIPLYNKALNIKKTIQSVLNQTYSDFEIVVIDDGSTDNSLSIVNSLNDARLRIIEKANGGVSSARNRGVLEANNVWVAFLDGDDIWEPNHLQVVYDLIVTHPKDKVFCTAYVRSDRSDSSTVSNDVEIIPDYFKVAKKFHFFWTSVAVIHRDVLINEGLFREDLNRGEDLSVWANLGRKYRFVRSRTVTATYVQDSHNKLTKSKYDYKKSVFIDIHLRRKNFIRKSEKKYYQLLLLKGAKTFLYRLEILNCLRTLYRLVFLSFVAVEHESENKKNL